MVIDKKFLNVQNVASNKEFLVLIEIFFMKQEHVRWKEPKFSNEDIRYQILSKFGRRVRQSFCDVVCMWQLSNLAAYTCQNWQLRPVKTDSWHMSKLTADTCQNLTVLFLTVEFFVKFSNVFFSNRRQMVHEGVKWLVKKGCQVSTVQVDRSICSMFCPLSFQTFKRACFCPFFL
jgi:hypothetical protein